LLCSIIIQIEVALEGIETFLGTTRKRPGPHLIYINIAKTAAPSTPALTPMIPAPLPVGVALWLGCCVALGTVPFPLFVGIPELADPETVVVIVDGPPVVDDDDAEPLLADCVVVLSDVDLAEREDAD
jgi:hypothetical protein